MTARARFRSAVAAVSPPRTDATRSRSETLDASASTGDVTLQGGSGTDSLRAGSGTGISVAGTGDATLAAGSGSDHFVFEQGDAARNDTIAGFDPLRDLVLLFGYAADEAQNALAHASVQGGSLVLSLTDGTSITFWATLRYPLRR